MYSRQSDGTHEVRLPPNYSGNAFSRARANVHIARDADTTDDRFVRHSLGQRAVPVKLSERVIEAKDESRMDDPPRAASHAQGEQSKAHKESDVSVASNVATSLLSPLGSLGTEEILLIALALIIFQSGKDPDLALILLALLFVK